MPHSDAARSARLKQARLAAGFSSAWKAAQHFGWPYPTYAQHERGNGIGKAAERYAEAFNVSAAWLLTGEGATLSSDAELLMELFRELPPEYQERLIEDARILLRAADKPEPEPEAPAKRRGRSAHLP